MIKTSLKRKKSLKLKRL